jgi:predicted phage terminase large subunit-like protein
MYQDLMLDLTVKYSKTYMDGISATGRMIFRQAIERDRLTPKGVEQFVYNTAMEDGRGIPIFMEQEPGSSGVNTIDYYARKVLAGFSFKGHKTTGSKEIRANPVSAAAENGNVHLVRGLWLSDFLDEEAF